MAINWTDVTNIAPELSTAPAGEQTALLADVYLVLNVAVCGDRLDLCAKYWCAHQATMNKRKGIGGAITGQTVGQVSRQYAAPLAMDSDLEQTSYGLTLKRLIRSNPFARFMVSA